MRQDAHLPYGPLSAIGDEDDVVGLTEVTMQLTREVFLSSHSVFDFAAPGRDVFVGFISWVDGLSTEDVHDRTTRALDVLRGP